MELGVDKLSTRSDRRVTTRAIRTAACFWIGVATVGCGNSDNSKGGGAQTTANIVLRDENNYTSTASLTLPIQDTAQASDIDICWTDVTKDLQCHTVNPPADIDNVSLVRFLGLSQSEVQKTLISGELNLKDVDKFFEFPTTHQSTCTILSTLKQIDLATAINVQQDYVEGTDYVYALIVSHGTTPGVGSLSMTFLNPTSQSTGLTVNVPRACDDNGVSMLDFHADLHSAAPIAVPVEGPWVIDWSKITHDSQGRLFDSVDNLLMGFYQGKTVADLESHFFDVEIMATHLWQIDNLPTDKRTANLAYAQDSQGALFAGFQQQDGVWAIGLRCTTCQDPSPIFLAILDPIGGDR